MQESAKNIEKMIPPYLSLTKMQQLLSLLSSRSFSQLSPSDLTSRGFSKVEASQSIQALKFFGLIDSSGKLQGIQQLALKGEPRTTALKEIVKRGYSKLFERMENPARLPKEELYNEFIAEYNLSPRLTKSALPLFLWISNEAGFEVTEDALPRVRESSQLRAASLPSSQEKKKKTEVSDGVDSSPKFSNNYHDYDILGIRLIIPKTPAVDITIAKGGLTEIAEKIEEFAKTVKLNNRESGEVA